MKFRNKLKNVELIMKKKLLQKLEQLGRENYPNECGGFLVGYYAEDYKRLSITNIVLPKKQKSSSSLFERSIDGVKEILQKLYIAKKHYYIGEWHTHPNGFSTYSQTDLNAMIEIVNCKTVNIKNPILLILSVGKNKIEDFSIYIYDNKGLYKYEQESE